MSRRPLSSWIAVVALVAAIGVWVGYGYVALQPDSHIVAPGDRPWFWGLLLAGCGLDALVVVRSVRAPVGGLGLAWLALRALLSVGGFLFFTFPSYAIALFALSRAPRADPRADPSLPHAFRPVSAGWFGALTPLWWSQNVTGASQIGASGCIVCGGDRDAPIHDAPA